MTGKPLFIAPKGRTWKEFVDESKAHGWPSFRDEEVVWENVRALGDGEAVSLSMLQFFYEFFMSFLKLERISDTICRIKKEIATA